MPQDIVTISVKDSFRKIKYTTNFAVYGLVGGFTYGLLFGKNKVISSVVGAILLGVSASVLQKKSNDE